MVSRLSAEKRSASAYLASTQAIQGSSGIFLSSLIEICDLSSLQGKTTPRGREFVVQEIAFEKERGRNVQQFCELQEACGADPAFANLAFSIVNKRQSEHLRKGYFTDPKNFSSALNLHANVFINGTQWCYLFSHKFPRRPEFLRPKQTQELARETTPHRRLYQNRYHAAYPGRSQSLSFTVRKSGKLDHERESSIETAGH
jgi:hypothetical protein